MTQNEERERWLGMMEERNREIAALHRDIEGYHNEYAASITDKNKEIDCLRKMLGMSPLCEQEPAKVLRFVKGGKHEH
jgi:hypothetical protein